MFGNTGNTMGSNLFGNTSNLISSPSAINTIPNMNTNTGFNTGLNMNTGMGTGLNMNTGQGTGMGMNTGQGTGMGMNTGMGTGMGMNTGMGTGMGMNTGLNTGMMGGTNKTGMNMFQSGGNLMNQNQNLDTNKGMFGNMGNMGNMSNNQMQINGTYMLKYTPTKIQEQSNSNNQQKVESISLMFITGMPEYQTKSIEELRFEDVTAKKKGLVNQNMIQGMTNTNTNTNTGNNLFGNVTQTNNAPLTFGGGTNFFSGNTGNNTNTLGGGMQNLSQGGGMNMFQSSNTNTGLGNTSGLGLGTNTGSGFGLGTTSTNLGLGNTTTNMGFGNTPNLGVGNMGNTSGGLGMQSNTGFGSISNLGGTTGMGISNTGGNLFGSTGGNLINQQPQTMQNTGNSLFGQSTQQSGGLFGQSTQQQSGGLFGQNTGMNNKLLSPTEQQTGNFLGQPTITTSLQGTTAPFGQGVNNNSSLFGAKPTTNLGLGSITNTNQQGNTNLFGNKPLTGQTNLFQTSSLTTSQPNNSSLFGGSTNKGGLFGNQSVGNSGGLFSNTSNTGLNLGGVGQTGNTLGGIPTNQGAKLQSGGMNLFSNTSNTSQNQQDFYRNQTGYTPEINPLLNQPKKSITDILNELQTQYYEQDFLFSQPERITPKKQEFNYGESKYAYSTTEKNHNAYRYQDDLLSSFLKYKRNMNKLGSVNQGGFESNKYSVSGSGNKGLLDFTTSKYESPQTKSKESEDYEHIRIKNIDKLNREDSEVKLGKKSHSCDFIKQKEKVVVSNLEKSFTRNLYLEDEHARLIKSKKITENAMIDLVVTLQEPAKVSFSLKINKNTKINALKSAIVEQLKEKNSKMFKKINVNSFILMRRFSLIKESQNVSENGVKDGDTIHILLKETFEKHEDLGGESSSRKESKLDKKKKKANKTPSVHSSKQDLAPLDKLPVLTKPGYRTLPDIREIYRMPLSELEGVDNFSIYNEYGRIDFEGRTNLCNLNLDQIVNIEDKKINVYQNGDIDFKPQIGQGLNRPSLLRLYKCYPVEEGKNMTDEQLSVFLASLQKICKDKGAEFKNYDKNTGEWIFRVEHF